MNLYRITLVLYRSLRDPETTPILLHSGCKGFLMSFFLVKKKHNPLHSSENKPEVVSSFSTINSITLICSTDIMPTTKNNLREIYPFKKTNTSIKKKFIYIQTNGRDGFIDNVSLLF